MLILWAVVKSFAYFLPFVRKLIEPYKNNMGQSVKYTLKLMLKIRSRKLGAPFGKSDYWLQLLPNGYSSIFLYLAFI